MKSPFRRSHYRPRFLLACVPIVALFALARPTPVAYAAGCVLIAAGVAIRVWGAGHLVKTDVLTVTGPYAYLRHPLYAGTLLVASGFAVGSGAAACVLLPPLLLVFFGYYFPYKERIESARLERIYGEPYAAYRARVPALLPARPPFRPESRQGAAPRWSSARFRDNHEAGTLLAVAIGLVLLALRPLAPL